MGTVQFATLVVVVIFWASCCPPAQSYPPPFTYVKNATQKGALCLNGSIPSYQLDPGHGNGASNWMVHLEGGGWCYNEDFCFHNRTYASDINKHFEGIQSPNHTINPEFFNWNKIYVRYCDFGGYLTDTEERSPKFGLYNRGGRIFKAVVEDVLERGMADASNVILSGDSAGALAAMYHCDQFREMARRVPRVKCVADAGYFIHGNNSFLSGLKKREEHVFGIVEYLKLADKLPKPCTSRMVDPRLCFFPEYFVRDIKTPLFIVNSAFDFFQLMRRVDHVMPDWYDQCYNYKPNCTSAEMKIIQDFGKTFRAALPEADSYSGRGMFVHTHRSHVVILYEAWHTFRLENKTISQAVADWFFDRTPFRVIAQDTFPI